MSRKISPADIVYFKNSIIGPTEREWEVTKHHRKPRYLNGSDGQENISYITLLEHRCWHILFNHLDAISIAGLINYWEKGFQVGIICNWNEKEEYIKMSLGPKGILRHLNTDLKSMRHKQKCAWEVLFRGLTPKQIIEKINRNFLDPDYRLVIYK